MIAEGGIEDVLLTYNILGKAKLQRLRALAGKVRLSVVCDNITVARGLSDAFRGTGEALRVLIECDTGAGRCGAPTPEAAATLASAVDSLPGLRFAGLMTYPPSGQEAAVQDWLSRAIAACEARGLTVGTVSNGGTPGMWQAQEVPAATEYRIGTYIYNDRSLVVRGTCGWKDCDTAADNLTGDPLFVGGGDYHLQHDFAKAAGPAIDALLWRQDPRVVNS